MIAARSLTFVRHNSALVLGFNQLNKGKSILADSHQNIRCAQLYFLFQGL
jgi:hypothetical protein